MKPRIRAKFVKKVYVRASREDDPLMNYPEGRNLVHFGSAPGTTYDAKDEDD